MDVEPSLSQVKILDAQIKGLGDAEPARVEHMNNQSSGIAMHIGNRRKQLVYLGLRRTVTQGRRSPGAKSIDGADLLMKNIAIEEEQGAERLVLSGSGNAGVGQLGEERLNLLFSGLGSRSSALEKEAETVDPVGVGFPGAE